MVKSVGSLSRMRIETDSINACIIDQTRFLGLSLKWHALQNVERTDYGAIRPSLTHMPLLLSRSSTATTMSLLRTTSMQHTSVSPHWRPLRPLLLNSTPSCPSLGSQRARSRRTSLGQQLGQSGG